MTIQYLADSSVPSPSANSVQVMRMCEAFAASGQNVRLWCYLLDDRTKAFIHYGVPENFELKAFTNITVPGLRRLLRIWQVWAEFGRLKRMNDVVYGRDIFGLLAAAVHGLPVALEAHTPPNSLLDTLVTKVLLTRPNFARLIVISASLKDEFLRLFPALDPTRIVIAHDGAQAEPEIVKLSSDWPGDPKRIQLGYVGSLFPGKGADVVVDLAGLLPEYDFHIVGGKDEEIALLKNSSTQENLFFHGHVPHNLIPAHIARFDIALFPGQRNVVLPSGEDIGRWTSPLKLFEYMAGSKAIVASAVEVSREVLRDGANAVLVPPDDRRAWVKAIRRLADDPLRRQALGLQARQDLNTKYAWSVRSRKILADIVEPRYESTSGVC